MKDVCHSATRLVSTAMIVSISVVMYAGQENNSLDHTSHDPFLCPRVRRRKHSLRNQVPRHRLDISLSIQWPHPPMRELLEDPAQID